MKKKPKFKVGDKVVFARKFKPNESLDWLRGFEELLGKKGIVENPYTPAGNVCVALDGLSYYLRPESLDLVEPKAKCKNIADCQWCISKLKDLVKEMEGKKDGK